MVSLDVLALDTSGRVIIMSLIIQELVYERPYMVLPPLIEWLRVTVGNIFFHPLQIFLRNTAGCILRGSAGRGAGPGRRVPGGEDPAARRRLPAPQPGLQRAAHGVARGGRGGGGLPRRGQPQHGLQPPAAGEEGHHRPRPADAPPHQGEHWEAFYKSHWITWIIILCQWTILYFLYCCHLIVLRVI